MVHDGRRDVGNVSAGDTYSIHDGHAGKKPARVITSDRRAAVRRRTVRERLGKHRLVHACLHHRRDGIRERVIRKCLEFLHIRETPVGETCTRRDAVVQCRLHIAQRCIPSHRRPGDLSPHETRVEIGHGAISVVLVVVSVRRRFAAHVTRMIAESAACTDRFGLGLGAKATPSVRAPHTCRAGAANVARPPILRRARRVVWEESRVQRRVRVVVIEDAEKLARRGQAPIGEAAGRDAGSIRHGRLPSALAAVHLLPHEARDIVSDRAVAIVRE